MAMSRAEHERLESLLVLMASCSAREFKVYENVRLHITGYALGTARLLFLSAQKEQRPGRQETSRGVTSGETGNISGDRKRGGTCGIGIPGIAELRVID